MYTEHEYLYGWLFYAVGALIMIGCFWFLTKGIKYGWMKVLLHLVVAVVLFTPWYASEELEYLAPAWLIAAYEGVFEGGDAFWRAGAPLISATVTTLVIAGVIILILYFVRRRPKQPATS